MLKYDVSVAEKLPACIDAMQSVIESFERATIATEDVATRTGAPILAQSGVNLREGFIPLKKTFEEVVETLTALKKYYEQVKDFTN